MFLFIAKWLIARNPAMTPAHAKKLAKIGVAIAAVALLIVGFIAWDWWDDRQAVEQAAVEREIAAGEQREVAADERVKDALDNAEQEEDYREAIETAPGGKLSPAAHALACERLRRIGRIPPACRPAGSNRAEAPAD